MGLFYVADKERRCAQGAGGIEERGVSYIHVTMIGEADHAFCSPLYQS